MSKYKHAVRLSTTHPATGEQRCYLVCSCSKVPDCVKQEDPDLWQIQPLSAGTARQLKENIYKSTGYRSQISRIYSIAPLGEDTVLFPPLHSKTNRWIEELIISGN